MCRGGLSAHGRASPALNAEAFPHDSADLPTAGLGRMCSIAPTGPAPHARYRQRPPRHRGRAHNTARATPRHWPRPIADHRFLRARPARPDGDRPEDTADPWPAPEFFDKKTLCIYNCVVLPDTTATSCTSTSSRLNAPAGCVVLPDKLASPSMTCTTVRLNAPTGAWCSLTSFKWAVRKIEKSLNAPTGAWCSLTKEGGGTHERTYVSMHLQVRGAP